MNFLLRSSQRNNAFFKNQNLFNKSIRFQSSSPTSSGMRGGIIGFLFGLTTAGATGYVYLIDEYQNASHALLLSVEDVAKSTNKLKQNTNKVDALEKDFKEFKSTAASQVELDSLKNEVLKLIDEINISHLNLKTDVWDLKHRK
ncbi:hypothetical protein HDU92_008306 [Lobulomyces angularis]|nr:hypothetical protein HDU92_008306 [Lobulomyces angularis]